MANRYWVGGVGNWNATAGTKWATTSGGAGGSAVPTSSDDVFLDAAPARTWITLNAYTLGQFASPTAPNGYCYEATTAGTTGVAEPAWPTTPGNTVADGTAVWTCRVAVVTVTASSSALGFTQTGFTGTLAGSAVLAIYASATFAGTITYTGNLSFRATTTGFTITSNGIALSSSITFNGVGGGWTLADALSTSDEITLTNGAFSDGNFSVTAVNFNSSNSNTRTITKGTATWTLSGASAPWNTGNPAGLTFTDTGTLSLTDSSATARTFATGALAFNDFNVTAGSGSLSITGTGATYRNVSFTGYTGAFQSSAGFAGGLTGNLTLGAGMTMADSSAAITFTGTSGTQVITTNGVTLGKSLVINTTGASVQLADNLTANSSRGITLTAGTLDFNNKDTSLAFLVSSNSNTRSLTLGSGTCTITGNNSGTTPWQLATSTNLTFSGASSTIKLTDATTNGKDFNAGDNLTYGTIWLSGGGTGVFNIQVGNGTALTCSTLKVEAAETLKFSPGQTFNIGSFVGAGTAGNLITLGSIAGGSSYTLKYTGAGCVSTDYMSVSDMTGGLGYLWFFGKNSTHGSNCKGVAFDTPEGAAAENLSACWTQQAL